MHLFRFIKLILADGIHQLSVAFCKWSREKSQCLPWHTEKDPIRLHSQPRPLPSGHYFFRTLLRHTGKVIFWHASNQTDDCGQV